MTREEKVTWMAVWCAKNNLKLNLEGECGIGRECVGISTGDQYPSYTWMNDDYERIDDNGNVWTPPNAYHKADCVAVLGRGEEAESELYDWLQWFDQNGFKLEEGEVELKGDLMTRQIQMMMGQHRYARLVRPK